MNIPVLAFDRATVRSIDADGRLHVARTHISKANVCPYMGSEIPGWPELGLKPDQIYRLYRDPVELERGAASFRNLPLLRRHIQVSASDPMKDDVVGSIGSDVAFDAPYLDASLCIWDSEAIAGIDTETIMELSSAYRYKADMTPGHTADGEPYDGRMTDIIGNHLALVDVGRAGSDVVVADSNPFTATNQPKETPAMKPTKLGRALLVALSAASPKIAQDAALPSLVGGAVKGKFNLKTVSAKLIAMDEELTEEKIEEIVEAILEVTNTTEPKEPEQVTITADEGDEGVKSKHAEIIDFLRSKGLDASDLEAVGNMLRREEAPYASDEDVDAKVEEGVKTAMDSMRKEFRALEMAKSAVRPVVGDVIGMDSAEGIYRFALDHLKIDHKDMPAAGLGRLFDVAAQRKAEPTPRIAADGALAKERVPGLARFS